MQLFVGNFTSTLITFRVSREISLEMLLMAFFGGKIAKKKKKTLKNVYANDEQAKRV